MGSDSGDSLLAGEIRAQPEALERFARLEGQRALDLGARLAEPRPVGLLIAARGSSDHAAVYAKYLFGLRVGLPVALAAPSLVTAHGVTPVLEGWVALGISQSGASPDVVAVVRAARAAGAPTLAITDRADSDLARAAEHTLPLHLGEGGVGGERSVAATGSYTTTLSALAHLAVGWGDGGAGGAGHRELEALPEGAARALSAEEPARALATELADCGGCTVLGRGFGYPAALELALKLKELAGLFADPYSAADYRHGPIALAAPPLPRPPLPALVIDPAGPTLEDLAQLQADLIRRGVRCLRLADGADAELPFPPGPDWLAPIPIAVVGQLLAFHLARARGLDPDRPRGIAKITRTL